MRHNINNTYRWPFTYKDSAVAIVDAAKRQIGVRPGHHDIERACCYLEAVELLGAKRGRRWAQELRRIRLTLRLVGRELCRAQWYAWHYIDTHPEEYMKGAWDALKAKDRVRARALDAVSHWVAPQWQALDALLVEMSDDWGA
jgi:hypothetical protein